MANIITTLSLEMSANWYVSKKLNSIGRVGENTVTKLIIEPTEILDDVTYEIEIMSADGSKNVAELTIDGTELYLILTANMLTTSGITKMQVRGLFSDGSIKKSNIFELKVNRSISATEAYEEYAVTIFDQLVQDCRDIIEGAESYAVRAETAATNAEAYEQSASASAEAASASASTASTASTAAVNAAASAESASTSAHTSAETATTAANSASASASTAQTSAQTATNASATAQSASEAAQTASTTATTAATNAGTAASTATTAASNASASATSAAADATNAAISEANASTSATNAAASETNAATSATNAANSATSASTSATNAANSASAAAISATNAHTSEVNASTSETNASTSAAEAEASAESIAASVAQINENTYRINDLEAIIAGYQLTDLPTGAVASITDGTALLMPSLKVGIEPVQSGSGDPSPENIRPISGWTAANVTRCGKNLYKGYDVTPDSSRGLSFTTQNGKLNVQGVYNKNNLLDFSFPIYSNSIYPGGGNYQNYIDLTDANTKPIKAGNYALSIKSTRQIMVGIYVANELGYSVKSGINLDKFDYYETLDLSTNHVRTFELNRGGYLGIFIRFSDLHENDDINETIEIQLELGSTATTYEPYNGQTYNIQFRDGDNPLTVYGGTLDVTSGELVVDRVEVDLGTLNYIYYSGNLFTAIISGLKGVPNTVLCNALCSIYVAKEGNRYASIDGSFVAGFNNASTIAIHDSRFTDVTAFKTAMNGVQLVYELATPVTYQLTPTQIRTLVGNNNIWADTGNIIEGKYFKSLV